MYFIANFFFAPRSVSYLLFPFGPTAFIQSRGAAAAAEKTHCFALSSRTASAPARRWDTKAASQQYRRHSQQEWLLAHGVQTEQQQHPAEQGADGGENRRANSRSITLLSPGINHFH